MFSLWSSWDWGESCISLVTGERAGTSGFACISGKNCWPHALVFSFLTDFSFSCSLLDFSSSRSSTSRLASAASSSP